MPTKMKSFRLNEYEVRDLHDMAVFFNLSETSILSDLIGYLACRVSDYLEDPDKVPELVSIISAWHWGYDWKNKLADARELELERLEHRRI